MKSRTGALSLTVGLCLSAVVGASALADGPQSVARQWNDTMLNSIKKDRVRPPVQARNLFHLLDGDPQFWRGRERTVLFPDAPLANLFAGFLLRDGDRDPLLEADGGAGDMPARLYRRMSGYEVTVLRYRDCAITDAEMAAAREQGVRLQVVDLESGTSETLP